MKKGVTDRERDLRKQASKDPFEKKKHGGPIL
jgi:hypothetical protein